MAARGAYSFRALYPDFVLTRGEHRWFVHKFVLAKHAAAFRDLLALLPHTLDTLHLDAEWDASCVHLAVLVMYESVTLAQALHTLGNTNARLDFARALHMMGCAALLSRCVELCSAAHMMSPVDALQLYYHIGDPVHAHALVYGRIPEWMDVRTDEATERACVGMLRKRDLLHRHADGTRRWWRRADVPLRAVWNLWALWMTLHGADADVTAPLVAYLLDMLSSRVHLGALAHATYAPNFHNVLPLLEPRDRARIRGTMTQCLIAQLAGVDDAPERAEAINSALFS